MLPSFAPSDHLLTFNWVRPKVGDVVVLKIGNKNYLKRVKKILGDQIFTAGDNQKESARMVPIDIKQVIGKVILKY